MYSSVIDINRKRYVRMLITYVAICIFCIIFNAVYTHFSYGMSSQHMKYMFLFPLSMGIIPSLFLLIAGSRLTMKRVSFNLWNCSCATFTVGCVVVGIINNSGRNTDAFVLYSMIGILLLFLSFVIQLINKK